jgi:hypothetical protein
MAVAGLLLLLRNVAHDAARSHNGDTNASDATSNASKVAASAPQPQLCPIGALLSVLPSSSFRPWVLSPSLLSGTRSAFGLFGATPLVDGGMTTLAAARAFSQAPGRRLPLRGGAAVGAHPHVAPVSVHRRLGCPGASTSNGYAGNMFYVLFMLIHLCLVTSRTHHTLRFKYG